MQTHNMNLQTLPFEQIQNGVKKIEIRLFDEKRRKLRVGDSIEFTHAYNQQQKLVRKVTAIISADSLHKLFQKVSLEAAGWPEDASTEKAVSDMRKYYSEEEEKRYGAIAIYFE